MLTDAAFKRSQILATVCAHYNISVEDIRSRRRHRSKTLPRHVAAWLMRRAGHRVADIGDEINRDHSTVSYSVTAINRMCLESETFRAELKQLEEETGDA